MKIGILGAGKIACKMAETINLLNDQDVELYAIGSSSYKKSEEFAKKYGIEKAYGSYEELVSDEAIDLIYVATIHSKHFEHALLCLNHQKNVLVEKPFTLNVKEAKHLFEVAKEKNLFICEAMWTRFMPSAKYFKEIIKSQVIGEVYSVSANIGYNLANVERMNDLTCGGGALLDIGIYLLHFAMMVCGDDVKEVNGQCVKLPSGVDGLDSITMIYPNKIASLHATMLSNSDNHGYIYGSLGYLKVDNINNPQKIERFNNNHQCVEVVDFSKQLTGFEDELLASLKAIKENKLECREVSHQLTLQVLAIMDELRKSWQVIYPSDCF